MLNSEHFIRAVTKGEVYADLVVSETVLKNESHKIIAKGIGNFVKSSIKAGSNRYLFKAKIINCLVVPVKV